MWCDDQGSVGDLAGVPCPCARIFDFSCMDIAAKTYHTASCGQEPLPIYLRIAACTISDPSHTTTSSASLLNECV